MKSCTHLFFYIFLAAINFTLLFINVFQIFLVVNLSYDAHFGHDVVAGEHLAMITQYTLPFSKQHLPNLLIFNLLHQTFIEIKHWVGFVD